MSSLWTVRDTITATKLNKSFNTGLDADKGLPSVVGEGYLATDTYLLYISEDGLTWSTSYAKNVAGGIAGYDSSSRVFQANSFNPTPICKCPNVAGYIYNYAFNTIYQNGSRTRLVYICVENSTAGVYFQIFSGATNPPGTAIAYIKEPRAGGVVELIGIVQPNYYYKATYSSGSIYLYYWQEFDL